MARSMKKYRIYFLVGGDDGSWNRKFAILEKASPRLHSQAFQRARFTLNLSLLIFEISGEVKSPINGVIGIDALFLRLVS